MANSVIRDISEETDESPLILMMDRTGNLTFDEKEVEKILKNKRDRDLRIIRLSSTISPGTNHKSKINDGGQPGVDILIEEIDPDTCNLVVPPGSYSDTMPDIIQSTESIIEEAADLLTSHEVPDIADPFSQMDREQLEILENALASEQAKQILGENVTAMLDMLSVEDSTTLFVQNSIKNDHCYTTLLPTSDPNGPSFVLQEIGAGTEQAKLKTKPQGRSVNVTVPSSGRGRGGGPGRGGRIVNIPKQRMIQQKKSPVVQRKLGTAITITTSAPVTTTTTSTGGSSGGPSSSNRFDFPQGLPFFRAPEETQDPDYDVDVDVVDSDNSANNDRLSDEDYRDRRPTARTRGGRRRVGRPSLGGARTRGGKSAGGGKHAAKNHEKLDDEMERMLESLDGVEEIKLKPKKKVVKLVRTPAGVVTNHATATAASVVHSAKVVEEIPQEQAQPDTPTSRVGPAGAATPAAGAKAKYPKRENRKPPAYLMESLGPALFSTPDIIKRINAPDTPQGGVAAETVPAEKKNLSVGLVKTTTQDTAKTQQRTIDSYLQSKQKPETVTAVPAAITSTPVVATAPATVVAVSVANDTTSTNNVNIQKLLESQVKMLPNTSSYNEEYLDDEEEEECGEGYLDLSQMDHSLLVGYTLPQQQQQPTSAVGAVLVEQVQDVTVPSSTSSETLPGYKPSKNDGGVVVSDNPSGGEHSPVKKLTPSKKVRPVLEQSPTKKQLQSPPAADGQQHRRSSGEHSLSKHKTVSSVDGVNPVKHRHSTDEQQPHSVKQKVMEGGGVRRSLSTDKSPTPALTPVESHTPDSDARADDLREDRRRSAAKRRRSDEVSDIDSDAEDDLLTEASWNSEDDPDRLWCICRKPHNNRFMICCDACEEWFHGKCVGITKAIGKQMEADGLEWSCPNCTKKKRAGSGPVVDTVALLPSLSPEKSKLVKGTFKQTKVSDYSRVQKKEGEGLGRACIMCKKTVRENSIYCSDDCIRRHSQQAISQIMGDGASKQPGSDTGAGVSGQANPAAKPDSRILVMEASSKKILAGQQAPTASNLATWLKENPNYHVVYRKQGNNTGPGAGVTRIVKLHKVGSSPGQKSPGVANSPGGGKVVGHKTGATPGQHKLQKSGAQDQASKQTQLKLTVSPNSKQVKIVQQQQQQQPVKKLVYQVVKSQQGTSILRPATILVRQNKQAEVIDALPLQTKSPAAGGGAQDKTGVGEKKEKQETPKVVRKRKEKPVATSTPAASTLSFVMSSGVKEKPAQQTPAKTEDKNEQFVRESVRKVLCESLKARVNESKTGEEYKNVDIETLVVKIEDRLYKNFDSKTDTKYKSRYRSLVFNIKDPKNQTLFRKILGNSISPEELVKLSPEELASQELARWREKENQHQLEIIKKNELELLSIGNTYIMKSHKGEQVIETGPSEKVATAAAEIDPNTPAKELVSALNSVSSTTQDAGDVDDGDKKDKGSLHKIKDRERSGGRDRKHSRREKSKKKRSRSRSRSRNSRKDHKTKRDRSRSRYKSSSTTTSTTSTSNKQHRKTSTSEEEKKRSGEAGNEVNTTTRRSSVSGESVSKTGEQQVHVVSNLTPVDDDREPSSTVIIKTPDINIENLVRCTCWSGTIVMADVAKFESHALELIGDCSNLERFVPDKMDVVGRIPYDTVWEYIARMKKLGTKDIVVVKLSPDDESDYPVQYETLYQYLSKRSRIGVIGRMSEAIKDFYIYPLDAKATLPEILLPTECGVLEGSNEHMLLGIIVRNRVVMSRPGYILPPKLPSPPLAPPPIQKPRALLPKPLAVVDDIPLPPSTSSRSYTPPPTKHASPSDDEVATTTSDGRRIDPRIKRKIKVQVEVNNEKKLVSKLPLPPGTGTVVLPGETSSPSAVDDDSPYSPGSSDDELSSTSLLPKRPKLSDDVPSVNDDSELLKDPEEIQKKIEEMSRAIEEKTQQLQSMIPAVAAVLPSLGPNAPAAASSVLASAIPLVSKLVSTVASAPVESPKTALEEEERYSPSRSFTPPPSTTSAGSELTLPSNLQEILNSIQKKPGGAVTGPPPPPRTPSPPVLNSTSVVTPPPPTDLVLPIIPGLEPDSEVTNENVVPTSVTNRFLDEKPLTTAEAPVNAGSIPLPDGLPAAPPPPSISTLIPPDSIPLPDTRPVEKITSIDENDFDIKSMSELERERETRERSKYDIDERFSYSTGSGASRSHHSSSRDRRRHSDDRRSRDRDHRRDKFRRDRYSRDKDDRRKDYRRDRRRYSSDSSN